LRLADLFRIHHLTPGTRDANDNMSIAA